MLAWCAKCARPTRRRSRLVGRDDMIVAEIICDDCDFIYKRRLVKGRPPAEPEQAPAVQEAEAIRPASAVAKKARRKKKSKS